MHDAKQRYTRRNQGQFAELGFVTRCRHEDLSKKRDSAAAAQLPPGLQASLMSKEFRQGPGCGVSIGKGGDRVWARQGKQGTSVRGGCFQSNPGVFASPAMAVVTEAHRR